MMTATGHEARSEAHRKESFRNPLGNPPSSASVATDSDASDDESEPDFSMMGSALLGGATLPPSKEEREQFIKGVEIRAKYVGAIEVPQPKGMPMTITAISRVRAQHKLGKEKKPKMRFVISTTGLRVYDEKTQLLRDTHPLTSISSIATLPANKKVFAFITTSTANSRPTHTCHVFKTNKKSLKIKEMIGQCFTLQAEIVREREGLPVRRDSQRSKRESMRGLDGGWASPERSPGPNPRQSTASASAYLDVSPNRPGTTSADSGVQEGQSFDVVMHRVRQRIDAAGLGKEDRAGVLAGLAQLQALHAATEAENAKLTQKKSKLQAEVVDLKQKLVKSISIAQTVSGRLSEERRMSGRGPLMSLAPPDASLRSEATEA